MKQLDTPDAAESGTVAAVILAAGFSTRMKRFKPLLPFGGKTVLAHVTAVWREGGVRDQLVVSGFQAERVEDEAGRLGAGSVRNRHPEDGMFSSVACGLAAALVRFPAAQWFGIHPVDIPLIAPDVIRSLVTAAGFCEKAYCMPACDGLAGHPPLLSRALAEKAVTTHPAEGLKSILQEADGCLVPVSCPYIDFDMDRPEEYEKACRLLGLLQQTHPLRP